MDEYCLLNNTSCEVTSGIWNWTIQCYIWTFFQPYFHLNRYVLIDNKEDMPWNQQNIVALQASSNYGHALNNVKAGSTMGVMIDSAQCLHLFVDGKDQGVAYRGVKHPCYVIIDFCYLLRKVLLLASFIQSIGVYIWH